MGTITKALALLDLFSQTRSEIGLAEFQRLTGRDKATVYRHLRALEQSGLLEQSNDSRAYRLGHKLVRLAQMRDQTQPIRDLVQPFVDQMSEEVRELVHLSMYRDGSLETVYASDQRGSGLRVSFDEFEFIPIHASASGHAVMAFMDDGAVRAILDRPLERFTQATPLDADDIISGFRHIRARGYSMISECIEEGVAAIGAPLFDANGEVQGSVAVAYPLARGDAQAQIIASVLRTAPLLTHAIGGILPPDFPIPSGDNR